MTSFQHFIKDTDGGSLAEYAMLISFIVVASVTVTDLGNKISSTISKAITALPADVTPPNNPHNDHHNNHH